MHWHSRLIRRPQIGKDDGPETALHADDMCCDVGYAAEDSQLDDGGLRRATPQPLGKRIVLNRAECERATLGGTRVKRRT
jgi:hypothetical protein